MIHSALFSFLMFISTITLADGVYSPPISSIQLPQTLDVSGAYIGQTLWKSAPVTTYATLTPIPGVNVGPGVTLSAKMNSSSLSSYGEDVYSTNIPGIGNRWWGTWKGPRLPSGTYTAPIKNGPFAQPVNKTATEPQIIWVELIKTGTIRHGTLAITSNVEIEYGCPCSSQWKVSVSGLTPVVEPPKCSVAAPVPQVVLGKISSSHFSKAGDRSSPVLFSINLKCSGGAGGLSVGSYITLTDASKPGNVSGILSLSSQSSASGLGIQITNENGIVKYNPDSTAIGNTNQWNAGVIKPGMTSFKIPLRASYIQTGQNVLPGTAIGQATFTISFH